MTLLLPMMLGCGSVLQDYVAARDRALANPGPPPANWQPDAAIFLSAPLVADVVAEAADQVETISGKIDGGLVVLEPALELTRLQVQGGDCDRCLSADLRLEGTLGWSTPLLSGTSPIAVDGRLDAELVVERSGEVWAIAVAPRAVNVGSVEVGTLKTGADVRGTIVDWLGQAVLAALPPLPLAELGGEDLPARAVRVVPIGEGVRIDVLTAAPEPGRITPTETVPDDGFRVELALPSLLGLARAEAFRQDQLPHDLVAEPTALEMGPDGFVLGLRLWHVAAGAWWRDYTITGEIRLRDGEVHLVPTDVREDGHSKGAALADPLIALAEGAIVNAIDRAIHQTLPATHTERFGKLRTELVLESIDAYADTLVVSGTLDLRKAKRRRK